MRSICIDVYTIDFGRLQNLTYSRFCSTTMHACMTSDCCYIIYKYSGLMHACYNYIIKI